MSFSTIIEKRIAEALQPTHLEIINESANHSVPQGAESHFKVVVVSPQFDGKGLIDRHREVSALFRAELASGQLHALALHTYAPSEWTHQSPKSPDCQGGSQS